MPFNTSQGDTQLGCAGTRVYWCFEVIFGLEEELDKQAEQNNSSSLTSNELPGLAQNWIAVLSLYIHFKQTAVDSYSTPFS